MISRRTEAYAVHHLALLQQALEDQSHNDVKVFGGNKTYEPTDMESTGNIELLKVIKSDFSTHLVETRPDKGECCREN